MHRKSYAKVTLSLYAYKQNDILNFKNVIAPIDLFDMIYLEKSEQMEITTNKAYLPNDRRNTVFKTIELMRSAYNLKDNFKVHIVKNIPAQSGLGGGSSNAATIINMIDEMYKLEMTYEEKITIAKQIDEDTPYCILNIPSKVEGIGEVITPIELNTQLYYLLVKPSFGISTKSFLKKFDDMDSKKGVLMNKMAKACIKGNYNEIINYRSNSFENTVIQNYEAMQGVIDRLESLGLDGVGMTGSGSGVFGLSKDREKVMLLYEKIVFDYPFVKYGAINPLNMLEY